MNAQVSPYDLIRAIQDQQRATDRLVQMLAGMLDKSQPEPLLTFVPPALPQREPVPRKIRRVAGPAGRPPATYTLDGITIKTTERRAKIIYALREQPRGLSDLCRLGFAPRNNAMVAQISDINRDLLSAGSPFQIKAQQRPQRKTGRGSVAPLYALIDLSKIAPPGFPTAAQSEAAAGVSPEEAASDSAAGEGVIIAPAQDAEFVTPTGEGEERPGSVDPAPVAGAPLTPEKLAAVDVIRCRVFGPGGTVFVNTRAARILDVLKHGDLFGLDTVASKAKISTGQDCRHALRIETETLKSIGLEVWCDKFNVRLREAS